MVDKTSVSLFFQSTSAVDYNRCRLKGNNTDTELSRCKQIIISECCFSFWNGKQGCTYRGGLPFIN